MTKNITIFSYSSKGLFSLRRVGEEFPSFLEQLGNLTVTQETQIWLRIGLTSFYNAFVQIFKERLFITFSYRDQGIRQFYRISFNGTQIFSRNNKRTVNTHELRVRQQFRSEEHTSEL